MSETLISPSSSLEDYFRTRVEHVVERHRIDGDEDTRWYIVRLLCDYSRSHRFNDGEHAARTLVPLAAYYRQAVEAPNATERHQHLRRLGDVALFVASLFSGALARRPVDVGYYVSMGGSAYGALADSGSINHRERAFQGVFAELSEHFEEYVAALSEIPERVRDATEDTLLELIGEWEKTRHPGLAQRLRERGVFLAEDASPLH